MSPLFSRRIRTSKSSRQLDYSQLESRNLLSASTGAVNPEILQPQFLQAPTEFHQSANLFVNGDFETGDSGNASGFFAASEVAGWDVPGSDPPELSDPKIRLINFSHERSSVLQLDSSADIIDSVTQQTNTELGQHYVLAFEIREQRPDAIVGGGSNDLDAFWNGTHLGTFRAIQFWQTVTLHVTGDGDTGTLEFREVGGSGDGNGPFIDNVLLRPVSDLQLTNGGFENPNSASGVVSADQVEDWNSFGGSAEEMVIDLRNGIVAEEGLQFVNLDSSDTHVDRIYRDIDTRIGDKYFITFLVRAEGDPTNITNQLRVRWDGEWAGTFQGGNDWQSFGLLVEADSDVTRLVLREPPHGANGAGTGQGPWIDNVQVYRMDAARGDLIVDANGGEPGIDGIAAFTEDNGAVQLAPELTTEHASANQFTSATVQITNLLDGSDESLSADVTGTNIKSTYDSATGRLRLTGIDSVENYQAVLRTLKYNNVSNNPDTTNRDVTIVMVDDQVVGKAATVTVSVFAVDDAPIIDAVADQTTSVATIKTLQVVASDDDSSTLSYDLTYTGDAGVFEPSISDSGLVTWNSTKVSDLQVTVTVSDEQGASSSVDFQMTSSVERPQQELPSDFDPFSGQRQLSHVLPSFRNGLYSSEPAMTIDVSKNYEAVFALKDGDIHVELDPVNAPIAVNSFVALARDGFFDNLTFHRVISNFVAQGGDPAGVGNGGPGYSFVDEVNNGKVFDSRGQLAMANGGPNTNGSQFFITLAPRSDLNGLHTIFGQMTSGDEVLSKITIRDPNISIPADIIHSVTIIET